MRPHQDTSSSPLVSLPYPLYNHILSALPPLLLVTDLYLEQKADRCVCGGGAKKVTGASAAPGIILLINKNLYTLNCVSSPAISIFHLKSYNHPMKYSKYAFADEDGRGYEFSQGHKEQSQNATQMVPTQSPRIPPLTAPAPTSWSHDFIQFSFICPLQSTIQFPQQSNRVNMK